MNNYLKRAKELLPHMQKLQQQIHQYGGVAYDVRPSAELIKSELQSMGITPKEICECGIVATIVGKKPGKTVLLRADYDALPQEEITGLPYAATNGSCHSCGHDHHAAMLLGAARLLKENEDELEGTVKLMFQPDEEATTGAKKMINSGLMEDPKVDASFAIHIESGSDRSKVGRVIWSQGAMYSAADQFKVTVKGVGGHGSQPHKTIDPVTAACHAVSAVQHIISMEVSAAERAVLTFGQIHGGTIFNIIPNEVTLNGTIRTFSNDVREFMRKRFEEVMKDACKTMRCECVVEFSPNGVPPVINNVELAREIKPWIEDICGDNILTASEPLAFGSEDYAWIADRVPAVMMTLGAGVPADGYIYGAHNPAIHFDAEAMPYGVAVFTNLVINYLKTHK
ncbi:MAG: M20 family metallopeptidase [Clostridiaceae bacterium]|nr:M20 family metallopeptidase [Clostridiaceae bacterium]